MFTRSLTHSCLWRARYRNKPLALALALRDVIVVLETRKKEDSCSFHLNLIVMSHEIWNYAVGNQLTPIEQNGFKQYKRIAIILPLLLTGNGSDWETQFVQEEIQQAFKKAIETWPFLCCSVRTGVAERGKLTLVGKPAEYMDAQSEQLDPHGRPRIEYGLDEKLAQLKSNSLGAGFFRSEAGLSLATGMPIVMVKFSLLRDFLVVGFSFYEAVVDGEFIGRFFSRMINLTWSSEANRVRYRLSPQMIDYRWPHAADEVRHWYRWTFNPSTGPSNRHLFSFYDWHDRRLVPQITPKDRLVCRLIEFKKAFVTDLIGHIRQKIGSSVPGYKDEYFVVAMLWVTIIQARFLKRRIGTEDTARLNILLPGQPNALRGGEPDLGYFGSSTVPTVAELSVPRLLNPANQHKPNDFQGEIRPKDSVQWLANAASAIHWAINKVDVNYVRHLMAFKEGVRPHEDSMAYNRAIDRHRTGMVFEDWSGYSSDEVIGTPFTTGRAAAFLPCADDKEEGKIVLLPQRRGPDARENEIGWATWVCLDVEEMPVVLELLDFQHWIIGEAAANMNTMGSS
ncbi:hypothetical protein H0G86_002136 [Trichoderma simmonsii]|uniref:Uncharacterized protein n=1 Tax=Trichoderma simmonsii TaxID=1491479 RepID=A0A8G0P9V4_9HYPO|nr:hypothetical protein H0G86_002136 [Trichoderma simmonsii]